MLDEQTDIAINAGNNKKIIKKILEKLSSLYIFPDVAKKIETNILYRLQKKEYEDITSAKDSVVKLTEDVQDISRYLHLRVQYSFKPLPIRKKKNEQTLSEKQEFENYLKQINYGFEKVERLPGNIGYIDIRRFANPELGAETVAATMNFVKNTDALIFDLRQNGGGNPAMGYIDMLLSFRRQINSSEQSLLARRQPDGRILDKAKCFREKVSRQRYLCFNGQPNFFRRGGICQ